MTTTYHRENPSPRYRELLSQYQQAHLYGDVRRNIPPEEHYAGQSLIRYTESIRNMIKHFGAETILDYGSGKGTQYTTPYNTQDGQRFSSIPEYWDIDSLTCYDPGYEPFSEPASGKFDGVICTDVLEHVPEEDMEWVVEEMFTLTRKFLYVNATPCEAFAQLPNGENAHCSTQPTEWWQAMVEPVAARHPDVRYFVTLNFGNDNPQFFQG